MAAKRNGRTIGPASIDSFENFFLILPLYLSGINIFWPAV